MDYKELEQQNNFNSMLISILAHDLRQPLAAVIMTADVLDYTERSLSRAELNGIMSDLRDTATKSIELLDGLLYCG
jgi:K+-sensing histidine kinase KdpD